MVWLGLCAVSFCTGVSYQKHTSRIESTLPRSAFLGSSYWSSNFSTYLKSIDITNGKYDQNMGGSHFHLQSSMACLWIFMPIRKKNLVSILIFFKERVSFKSFTHRGGLTLVSQTNFYYDGHGFPYFYHLMCPLNYENVPTPIKELNSHF